MTIMTIMVMIIMIRIMIIKIIYNDNINSDYIYICIDEASKAFRIGR